ncbi:MAG: universal stress protein [Clostridium sp.]|nr:universal stress protein [Prevotella sp.]MCM1428179.1 universal stress protein [Clostridium sp.]MCM1475910.1 universal stress protein [Muribaculaceae bacterium]
MIALAVHNFDFAVTLKGELESHNIDVKLEGLTPIVPAVPTAVKVMIREKDLPLALKIIESGNLMPMLEQRELTGVSNSVLIPVDFSEMSKLAVRAGFEFAERLSLHPIILYAFSAPDFSDSIPSFDPTTGVPDFDASIQDAQVDATVSRDANALMKRFSDEIRMLQSRGDIPNVNFSSLVSEGIAEDVIIEFTRLHPPALVVMATRGKHKRQREMIGSVTAEVLDSCRVPLFTVPENYSFCGVKNIVRLAFFCNLDQHDILSLDMLMKMFGFPEVEVWLIPVNDNAGPSLTSKLNSLCKYFSENYPAARFNTAFLPAESFREGFEQLLKSNSLQMIIVPNKKKNIISRLFNPGIAHKLLFEKDMPMLALPV